MATGLQDKFSWKQVGISAVSAGVTYGMNVGGADSINSAISNSVANNAYAATFVQGAVRSTITQGISVATGLQKKFDWRGVAASAVSSSASYGANQVIGSMQYDDWNDMSQAPGDYQRGVFARD